MARDMAGFEKQLFKFPGRKRVLSNMQSNDTYVVDATRRPREVL